jgi:hypothetical protein
MLRSPSPSEAAPKSSPSAPFISSTRSWACTRFGSGWPPPKSGSGVPFITVPGSAPEAVLQDLLRVGAGDACMASKRMRKPAAELNSWWMASKSNRLSISSRSPHRVDDLHLHAARSHGPPIWSRSTSGRR